MIYSNLIDTICFSIHSVLHSFCWTNRLATGTSRTLRLWGCPLLWATSKEKHVMLLMQSSKVFPAALRSSSKKCCFWSKNLVLWHVVVFALAVSWLHNIMSDYVHPYSLDSCGTPTRPVGSAGGTGTDKGPPHHSLHQRELSHCQIDLAIW